MDFIRKYVTPAAKLPGEFLFPKMAKSLVMQAKAFLGKEIVVDPHWRAAPSLWLDESGKDVYKTWLTDIQREHSRSAAAFVFRREDMGAYIVYADYGKRWDGRLCSSDDNDNDKVDSLCHEIGHMLTGFSGNLSQGESRYIDEQCAIMAANMQKAAIGNQGKSFRQFPRLKAFTPPNFLTHDNYYDSFSVYTPSPIARYYETAAGKADGARRFLSPNGLVRYDLIAQEMTGTAHHLRMHLSTMELFGGLAFQLAQDLSCANHVVQLIPGFEAQKNRLHNSPRDEYAKTVLQHWWKAVCATVDRNKIEVMSNIYVGEPDDFPSIYHANGYFLNLAATTQHALAKRPHDYLLYSVHNGLVSMMTNLGVIPIITSKVKWVPKVG